MEDAIALTRVLSHHDGDVAKRAAEVSGRARDRSAEAAKRGAQPDGVVRAGRTLRSSGPGAVHLQPADGQPAHRPRKSQAARLGLRARRSRTGSRRAAASITPIPPMFTPFKVRGVVAEESRDRFADGDVHGRGRRAERFSPRSLRLASDGRRGDGVHGDDVRFAGRADHARRAWECGTTRSATRGSASSITSTRTRDAKIALQLGHSGRKGSTRRGWEGIDQPLASDNWPLVSASALPYIEGVSQMPREATREDMDRIKADFVAATESRPLRRDSIGSNFTARTAICCRASFRRSRISAPTNTAARSKTAAVIRWKFSRRCARCGREEKPMSVRISAHDWVPGGITPEDAATVARLFKCAGADVIDCSSGQVSKEERPVYGRMFQVPFLGSHPQRSRNPDHCGGQHFRRRPREHDHCCRARRPLRDCASAPCRSGLDAA